MRSCLPGILLASVAFAAPAHAGGGSAEPYVASRDSATFDRSLQCLTEAIYYEARNQSDDGQRAVAQVVLNRVRHPAYPNTVCGVVYQGSERTTGCQFSFTCTGVMGPIMDGAAWDRARRIAAAALRGSVFRPVGLAVNYHTTAIHPYWAPSLVVQTTVSRDIHELGLVKVRHASGRLIYALAEESTYNEELSDALGRWALTVEPSGQIVVVSTPYGYASALAQAYEQITYQTLADQVRRSVRSCRGSRWMFRVGHADEHPIRVCQHQRA